jgi:hypothetical protein
MSMTMFGHRISDGEISKDKILRRFKNLLNMTYLQAQPLAGGGYRIPEKIFESIQTELDFSPPDERLKKNREEETKKRYRQRKTYRFWKESLDSANIPNAVEAKEFLQRIFEKLDNTQYFGSMTQSCYASESLQLALDDHYGTNKLVLNQHSFLNKSIKKKSKKPKSSKGKARKKTAVKNASSLGIPKLSDLVPF